MKPIYVMMVGLPCAGKTTWIKDKFGTADNPILQFHNQAAWQMESTDLVIEEMARELGKTYSEVFEDVIDTATKYVEAKIKLASMAKVNLILDKTSLTKKSRQRHLNLLHNKDDYFKVAVVCEVDAETLKNRLTERNQSGKVIPASVMQRMQASYEPVDADAEGFDLVFNPFN